MPEILINADDRRTQITATSGQTVLTYDFPIYANTHIGVIRNRAGTLTTMVLTTDYTVTGVGAEGGGTVVLNSGATAGDVYTLYGITPSERTSDYGFGGDFASATVNKDFDWLVMVLQQHERDIARCLKLKQADTETAAMELEIETAANRLGRALIFNSSGTGFEAGPDSDDIAAAEAYAEAAEASASAAATSETNAATSETNAATSATAAASSASAAATSATNAATSETNAATSETNAATSATNAATSATAAASSATAAAASATAAATSETNAAISETNAATSETNAGNSATAAAASASAAAASAAAAASSAAEGLYNDVVTLTSADSPYTPTAGEEGTLYRLDTSSGDIIINLDTLANYGEDMKLGFVPVNLSNTVTINRGGTDTIGAGTSVSISTLYEVHVLVGDSATGSWVDIVQSTGIADESVTFAKMQHIGTDSLLGRDTAGTGDVEAISVGGGIEFTGSGGIQRSAISGDITIAAGSGTAAITAGAIVNADINASAAIDVSKLAALTASRLVVSDGSGFLTVSAATATEAGYLSGVTSAIQTQIDAKQATLSGASLTAVTVAGDDKVLIQDTSDSNNLKTVTAQSIADLAAGGSAGAISVISLTSSDTFDVAAAIAAGGTYVDVYLGGAGGSGGHGDSNDYGGGGGGGAHSRGRFMLADLTSSVSVTIGAGGAAATSIGSGNPGGDTSFGAYLVAYGGGSGYALNTAGMGSGGGGGGSKGAGGNATGVGAGGRGAAGAGYSPYIDTGGLGGTGDTTPTAGGSSYYGGGGGGGADNGSNTLGVGGNSYWGGAGGGGAGGATQGADGGVSAFGGDGGAGGFDTTAGTAGEDGAYGGGGGGGGGSEQGDSGAGGDGSALLIVF